MATIDLYDLTRRQESRSIVGVTERNYDKYSEIPLFV